MASKIVTGTMDGIRSLQDRSVKISFTTQELSPSDIGDLFSFQNKFCKLLLTDNNIISADMQRSVEDSELETWEKSKSPSQRLRSVLFLLFSKKNDGFTDFDAYYKSKMNGFIDHLKSKIED